MKTRETTGGKAGTAADSEWTPSAAAAHARLQRFLPRAGGAYARSRNYDLGPAQHENVSQLSPWIRSRVVSEAEVINAVLRQHGRQAEKFIDEVFWRTYFKGWLQQHPVVWDEYWQAVAEPAANDASLDDALSGRTGIACFDAWVRELRDEGYLHNHARMWFASIWVHTLRLPWQQGADLFMRHLLDGDPASNTLGWRWVAGLHTQGKTYLAQADNIARYTEGRFGRIGGLAQSPVELEYIKPAKTRLSYSAESPPSGDYTLVLTDDDLNLNGLPSQVPAKALILNTSFGRSPGTVSGRVTEFVRNLCTDAARLLAERYELAAGDISVCEEVGVAARFLAVAGNKVLLVQPPVGPAASFVEELRTQQDARAIDAVTRRFDRTAWEFCGRGFFGLKKKIPSIIDELGLDHDPGLALELR